MILGVNGYKTDRLNASHDASACVFDPDGQLIAAAEEERFSREKRAKDVFPHNAIEWCLREARVSLRQVTDIAIGWDYNVKNQTDLSDAEFLEKYLPRNKFDEHSSPTVHALPHHLAHASSSYLLSGFDEANVIVVDGKGEKSATTLYAGRGQELEQLQEFPIKDSLGFLIEELGNYLGMGFYAAGKVMGLAGYGSQRIHVPGIENTSDGYYSFNIPDTDAPYQSWNNVFDDILHSRADGRFSFDSSLNRFLHLRQSLDKFPEQALNLAFTIQNIIEEIILRIAVTLHQETGIRKLCLSGGVALNCLTNTRLLDTEFVDDIFIFPAANDGGCSVGAAANVLANKYRTRLSQVLSPYLGPEFSDTEIRNVLEILKISNAEYKTPEEIAKACARDLADGKVVGWFRGKMEMGPRALGHRSILANPAVSGIVDIVNTIKGRELWRPLAISILAGAVKDYFEDYPTSAISPYMLTTARGKPDKDVLNNVLHVDGTTRPQVVTEEISPLYHRLIAEFAKETGVPFVLNTSFNRFDEPIVCSPSDAVRTFYSMGLDSLFIGNFILRK